MYGRGFGGQDMSGAMTPAAKKYKCILWIWMIFACFIVVIKQFFTFSFSDIFMILIEAGILWCALSQLNYSMLTILLIYVFIPLLMDLFKVGAYLQDFNAKIIDRGSCGDDCNTNLAMFIICTADFIVQCAGVYCIFLEFREFKAITQEKSGSNYFAAPQGGDGQNTGLQTPANGQGTNMQQPPQNRQANTRNNNTSGANVFQGQGVRIGGN